MLVAIAIEALRRAEAIEDAKGGGRGKRDFEEGESIERGPDGQMRRVVRRDLKKILDQVPTTAQEAYDQTVEVLCSVMGRPLTEVHEQLLKAGQRMDAEEPGSGWTAEQIAECAAVRFGPAARGE